MNTTKIADKLIVALVKVFEKDPSTLVEPGFGLDIWDLAAEASIISKEEATQRRQNYISGAMDNLPSVQQLMVNNGWITTSKVEGDYKLTLYPTSEGIKYAHKAMRPWVRKAWDSLKAPVRIIVIAVITSIITTIVAHLILKLI